MYFEMVFRETIEIIGGSVVGLIGDKTNTEKRKLVVKALLIVDESSPTYFFKKVYEW
ncbi:hypothetical protein GS682_11610 [Nostoc sp. B(2019)]|nr:hypothetical protein [Nostoc sp. B(2019)]